MNYKPYKHPNMWQAIKNLLGFGPSVEYKELIKKGAIVVDVRSKAEYAGGHIRNSVNIPLDTLSNQLGKLKSKEQVVITCCQSGRRSGIAKGILKSKGYTQVYNGGGWYSLQQKLK
ncbi:rhodanese-like domain-containing protein [Cytophagales bacterium LB-30]|uniref:Rhodanese-like domain-containing protein n=1 Tax=Shiella aurantiaca TaxID=3058365 RepID=A0ABT8F883_9BACT|nr:rhodanese-like domain-containing protein [Shiella aurantiaca]MDN4166687.1 rhodanese-like domain-containing protein [Shiella aurantiaca]